ncbi:MAG TPA: DPP IV N-terminal domain-containing protein, partial [Pyrinomonadaceae bacterium]|nr:DPP IV N-terminal domain-containing protein [Pyrinomonadaceae bacterium]
MKQLKLASLAILIFASAMSAQDKLLTIDDIFSLDPKVRVNFSGTQTRLAWSADGRSLRTFRNGSIQRMNPVTGDVTAYYDAPKFRSALERAGVKADEALRISDSFTQQFDPTEKSILVTHAGDLWHYEIASDLLKRLTNSKEEELEADYSPDGKWVSFVRGNNLFVVEIARPRERQMTRDGGEKILNGYLDWVYEEELYGRGQKRGYWWSPDSRSIAFLRTDESPVPKFVIPNDTVDNQIVENTDYPQAGDPNPLVRLGIASVATIAPVKFAALAKYKPEDLLIGRVAWSPDSRAVVFQALNREQTFNDVNASDLNGRVTTLFQEKTRAWVDLHDNNPLFLKNGDMLWQSERNGWKHLYHYDRNGKLIRQVTDGKWEVRTVHGVDEARGWIY